VRLRPEDVEAVVRLARLALAPEERDAMLEALAGVLDHVAVIGEAGVDDLPPYTAAAVNLAALRPDEASPWSNPQALVERSPRHAEGLVVVPRIVEAS
jgi:aspartyl/glutamyl-tRNA(Asn/Gln) amidotransferase C subunit